jgi:streptogramin lyase
MMRKIGLLITVGLVSVLTSSGRIADANPAHTRTCPAKDTAIKIKTFSIGAVLGGLAIGPHGNVWFTVYDGDEIGRLDPRGKITYFSDGMTPNPEHPVVGAVGPRGITKGPDGNMWFTEYGADRIGRIAPDGTITEFSAGITPPSGPAASDFSDSAPHSIVTGPDGNLWFTEEFADRIGRITPDGAITEFSAGITPSPAQGLPGPHQYQPASPTQITQGPDGNLWFVEQGANRVGRITPEGVITEFPVPVEPSTFRYDDGREGYRIILLNAITKGPDGNVWFSANGGGPPVEGSSLARGDGAVGRITPSGEITQIFERFTPGPPDTTEPRLPPQPVGAGLRGITSRPDGNLWLLEVNGLVRITPSGKVTELAAELDLTPTGEEPMVAGPHGTLWFADSSDRDITRATVRCSASSGDNS